MFGLAVKKRLRGFSLVEVLIAVTLLAIGLLGLAALQTTALKYTYSANLRAKAVLLAYDMADRMRANMDIENNLFNADYNGVTTDDAESYVNRRCFLDDAGADGVIACNTGELVEYDAFRWTTDVMAALPNGAGSVARDDGDARIYNITLSWTDKSSDNSTEDFTLSIMP